MPGRAPSSRLTWLRTCCTDRRKMGKRCQRLGCWTSEGLRKRVVAVGSRALRVASDSQPPRAGEPGGPPRRNWQVFVRSAIADVTALSAYVVRNSVPYIIRICSCQLEAVAPLAGLTPTPYDSLLLLPIWLIPASKLEVNELPTAELAHEYDRIETCRVEQASNIPGRARDHVQITRGVLNELHEPERNDQ